MSELPDEDWCVMRPRIELLLLIGLSSVAMAGCGSSNHRVGLAATGSPSLGAGTLGSPFTAGQTRAPTAKVHHPHPAKTLSARQRQAIRRVLATTRAENRRLRRRIARAHALVLSATKVNRAACLNQSGANTPFTPGRQSRRSASTQQRRLLMRCIAEKNRRSTARHQNTRPSRA